MEPVHSLYRLPASLWEDLAQFRDMTEQFMAKAIPADRFQAFRIPLGIYEQRESGAYMLRLRLPAGIILPAQMRVVAEMARKYGDGSLHLSSRQDIQVHHIALENLYPALVVLAQAGLCSKGGGGNCVRNIAACPQAGVCPRETFDVTPHVIGLTELLLSDPLSCQLPRKYKIAFSGCGQDCALATINDLGFISKLRDGNEGFTVYVGGGMGAKSRVGVLLEEFIPTSQVCRVAEAIKRVFDKYGNRENRHHARLRFLLADLGLEAFTALYRTELEALSITPQKVTATTVNPPADGGTARRGSRSPVMHHGGKPV